jgi:hypothetical protein
MPKAASHPKDPSANQLFVVAEMVPIALHMSAQTTEMKNLGGQGTPLGLTWERVKK